jgi:hypothetical protein
MKTPMEVKLISELYILAAVFSFAFGVLILIEESIASIIPGITHIPDAVAAIGIILIVFGLLYLFVGLGLWKTENWARIVAIVFAIIGALGSAFSLVTGQLTYLVPLVIHGVIAGYLIWGKRMKRIFF